MSNLLESLSDQDLIDNIKENACNDSFKELANRHCNLFYKICQKYIKVLNSVGYSNEDIFLEKDIVIFDAARRFDPNKGALFSTWLGNYTRYFCLNKINSKRHPLEYIDEENENIIINNESIARFNDEGNKIDLEGAFEQLKEVNDKRIASIFKLRYNPTQQKKTTWANIANEMNLTVRATMQLHKRGIGFLREQIKNNNLNICRNY